MRTVLNRYLDTVGDGSGTKNANTNFVAADDFLIRPPDTQAYVIEGLTVIVEDTGVLLATGYGVLAALSTGIGLLVSRPNAAATEQDYLDGVPIKRHYDWARLPLSSPVIDTSILAATNSNQFIAQLIFPEKLVLNGKYSEALIVRIPIADLSGLDAHYFKAHGYLAEVN